jgi:N-acetylglucosaminyldiphosphoundecaprenol N-acetyl-beta-D-mannosaminyltransferase
MAGNQAVLFGVGVDSLTRDQILDRIRVCASSGGRLLIAHVNLHGLNLAYEQRWLREFYNQADLVYCDGMGVMLGAQVTGQVIRERFTLADWAWQLARLADELRLRLFLLGNPPGTGEKAAQKLLGRFPSLGIAGTQHGFFNLSPDHPENRAIIERINQLKPEILLVGLGMPLQERWLAQNWSNLDVNVGITCGALFEYLAGDLKRGPQWMTNHYLEWLARLVISPRRYVGRYFYDIPVFFYRVTKQRLYGKSDLFRR